MAKTPKKTKTVKARRKERTNRPHVVSFRITADQTKTLNAVHDRDSAMGVKTANQLARKVLCDFLAGRLEYRNAADRKVDFDAIG